MFICCVSCDKAATDTRSVRGRSRRVEHKEQAAGRWRTDWQQCMAGGGKSPELRTRGIHCRSSRFTSCGLGGRYLAKNHVREKTCVHGGRGAAQHGHHSHLAFAKVILEPARHPRPPAVAGRPRPLRGGASRVAFSRVNPIHRSIDPSAGPSPCLACVRWVFGCPRWASWELSCPTCPSAGDPADLQHQANVRLPTAQAALGCWALRRVGVRPAASASG